MARVKKDDRRATGIQGKKGYLYIIITRTVLKDGAKTNEKQWISTGLKDTQANVKKAAVMREKMLDKKTEVTIDRNISVSDYVDIFLERKIRETANTTYGFEDPFIN